MEALPPCLSRMASLTALRAAFNPLGALPLGPYLSSLQRLDVAFTRTK